jgi:uncharacterized membrane protein
MPNLPFNRAGARPTEAEDAARAPARGVRMPLVDAMRGIAVLAMVVYHFSWDLRYFGFLTTDVEGAIGWRLFARTVAGTFLFIVGVSLVLAERKGFDWRRFLRRLAVVAASAAAITVVTWFTFRDSYIFFGILHHIAVASVLGLAFVRLPVAVTLAAAVFSFAAPTLFAGQLFDHPALVWIGLSTTLPRSNDFVPLFPWFGVVLAGIAVARLWPRLGLGRLSAWDRIRVPSALLFVGRHTLLIYLLHQPILFGLVDLAAQVYPPDLLGFEPAYRESCAANCAESEVEADICEKTCACAAARAQQEGIWGDLMRQKMSVEQEMRYFTIVDDCRAAAEAQ